MLANFVCEIHLMLLIRNIFLLHIVCRPFPYNMLKPERGLQETIPKHLIYVFLNLCFSK